MWGTRIFFGSRRGPPAVRLKSSSAGQRNDPVFASVLSDGNYPTQANGRLEWATRGDINRRSFLNGSGKGPAPKKRDPGVPKPQDPILKYDRCATQVKNEANQNKWTVTLLQAVSNGNLIAACAGTGPDVALCLGVVGGVNAGVSALNFVSAQAYIYDGELQCLQNP
jgi:hypothetical protein